MQTGVVDAGPPVTTAPRAVLLDFSGTLFRNEDADHAVLAALGPDELWRAPELARRGALNGASAAPDLPEHLADAWARRDLDPALHRAAYSGIARDTGLDEEQAHALYERGISVDAWTPYPDTVRTLRALRERGVPVAIVSNIGWDPRPVLDRYGVEVDALVLSMERGVVKPDPAIFRIACAELGVEPAHAIMVGDNREADGASEAVGIPFRYVDADPTVRAPDALRRALGCSGTSE